MFPPTQRDQAGHNLTPLWNLLLLILEGAVRGLLFLSLSLRILAWINAKDLNNRAILQSFRTFIGPAIATLLFNFVFYTPILLILITVVGHGVSHKAFVQPLRGILPFYSILFFFFVAFSLPVLLLDRQVAFRNVLRCLSLSTSRPLLSAALVAPVLLAFLIEHLMGGNPSEDLGLRLLNRAIANLCFLFCIFVYREIRDPLGHMTNRYWRTAGQNRGHSVYTLNYELAREMEALVIEDWAICESADMAARLSSLSVSQKLCRTILQGGSLSIAKGTRVKIVDIRTVLRQIRVIDGANSGHIGWISADRLVPCRDPDGDRAWPSQ